MQDVLRGGPGNDTIYGGKAEDMNYGGNGTNLFIYGDEGDDVIWGVQRMEGEYIWGGSGDDEIHAGPGHTASFVNGNEGDDVIYPGFQPDAEDLDGGKGDDIIGVVDEDLLFDMNGDVDSAAWGEARFLSNGSTSIMNGGEGDDFLWGRYFATGTEKMYGGNGDDIIYGSYKAVQNSNTSTLAGQGGKDVIRTDIYKDNIADNNRRQFIVFGDWGYGEDGSYEGVQYGDSRLEKKL